MKPTKEMVDGICKGLVDKGMLIEAGWKSYDLLVLPVDCSTVQRNETRLAFFAGAQHLFASIMGILEPGAEPTDTDCRRLDAIDRELKAFIEDFKLRNATPRGSV